MEIQRPDLSGVSPAVRAYIEGLEAKVERLRPRRRKQHTSTPTPILEPVLEPNEPPTTMGVITINTKSVAKRSFRHLYTRQRRGGMGVFDLETPEKEPPAHLVVADEEETLLLISNFARAYHLPVKKLEASGVRYRGRKLSAFLVLDRGERIVLALPCPTMGAVAIVTQTGNVRRYQHHSFRPTMPPGMLLYSLAQFGSPAAACLTSGNQELFIVSRKGRAIRFPEKQIPPTGSPGIRLKDNDAVVGIAPIREDSGVFLLTADGKGTIRLMEGFGANKRPGAAGKVAMKGDNLVGAVTVEQTDDLFIISRLSKIVRFGAEDVPRKTGPVQGVHCMALRGDEAMAVVAGRVYK
ncbi:MAG: DNA gyrase C-terminal beta-propeller domain-containing protein [Ardenticatenaceae bacterium]